MLTQEEIDSALAQNTQKFIDATVSKPYQGQDYVAGKVAGVWQSVISGDPKTFNLLVAERDAATTSIVGYLYDYLVDYDYNSRCWKPRIADFKVEQDQKSKTLKVIYTLRDDLYWSYYGNAKEKRKVTSDDVIYWYDDIQGDASLQSSAYSSHFVTLPSGQECPITINKIDDRSFYFDFPVMEADPILATNMNFGPKKEFKEAKDAGGTKAVLDLFNVSCLPKDIPSMGPYFITEYEAAQRIVYERNADWWQKDSNQNAATYPQKMILSIVSDANAQYLLFRQGKNESYSPKPEELCDLVYFQEKEGYTVFNAQGSMGAQLWSFNQNPCTKDSPCYRWFTKKKFRQAMSCLLNRERIITQVYRGLAEPKLDFFPSFNAFHDEKIRLQYTYSVEEAKKLLKEAGFFSSPQGLKDEEGRKVEFDLSVPAGVSIANDIAQIISDECKKVGITVKTRQVDFQKLVEQLTSTYDWQSIIIGLGTNLFPSQGSNVWPSNGNLHLWHPLQKKPSTKWEARIDYLYNTAKAQPDFEKAKVLWDEYQKIILDECPVIYLLRQKSFVAVTNKIDFSNVYFDNMGGLNCEHAFFK